MAFCPVAKGFLCVNLFWLDILLFNQGPSMKLLNRLILFLLLTGFYAPAFAAVDGVELASCGVFSEDDTDGDKKDDEKTEESEPDCD